MLSRRQFLKVSAMSSAVSLLPQNILAAKTDELGNEITDYDKITTYNNFYEFSFAKENIMEKAEKFRTSPWEVTIEGEVQKPQTINLEELIKKFPQEERIYRMRCVEGWSRVVPWKGFELNKLIAMLKPLSTAKYIEFETAAQKDAMPNLRLSLYPWPYTERLRMDEAMNPLTILATGIMDKPLKVSNGAPIRLVVPWKYGFKGAKSVVKIRFVKEMPKSYWMTVNPDEYGFYANVNPNVDHPRWSQAKERVLGNFFRKKTLMFNGYEKQVAQMYDGMDLKKYF